MTAGARAEAIARNLEAVRARVREALRAAGRPPGGVTLVAVSKTMPAEDVLAAAAAGQRDFGENYGQELRDKRAALEAAGAGAGSDIRWHFIGPLQTNKVKYVAGTVALVHTFDQEPLLEEAERRAAARAAEGRGGARAAAGGGPATPQACLVQVNVAAEPQKRGIEPARLGALLDRFAALPHLACVGLMTIPPLADDPEASRPHFAALRRLRDEHARIARPRVGLEELSMGMSHDLEVAIAEGATLVRVGTAIFGARPRSRD